MYCRHPSARDSVAWNRLRPAPAGRRASEESRAGPSGRSSRPLPRGTGAPSSWRRWCRSSRTEESPARRRRPTPSRRSRCVCPARRWRSSTERQSAGTAPAGRRQCCRIVGIGARDDVQHLREIGHGARYRAPEVGHPHQRLDAGAAFEAVGAAQRHQACRARRSVERVAGLRSHGAPRRSFPPRQRPSRRSTRAATSTAGARSTPAPTRHWTSGRTSRTLPAPPCR